MNDFRELERGLTGALNSGLSDSGIKSALGLRNFAANKVGMAHTAPSALTEAGETLSDANRIVTRILELADRLCGPVPTASSTGEAQQYFGDGELGRLRANMRDTRQAFVFADEALNRIERELIG